jgi:RNA polymerase sigma-70 factor (ECF subfamily)
MTGAMPDEASSGQVGRTEPDPAGPAPDPAESDSGLLAAHVAGDAEAFATLVRRHQDRLWAVALRTLGDREEAADALQDALVSAYRKAGTFRGDAAVTTWLHRVVVNACLDRVRRRAARPTSPLPERSELADPRDDHASTETRLDVQKALSALPEHQRVALVLVDMQGLTVAQAAAVLDVAEGTVKSRCARGRAALAPLLGREPAEPSAPQVGHDGNHHGATDVPPGASTDEQREGGRP